MFFQDAWFIFSCVAPCFDALSQAVLSGAGRPGLLSGQLVVVKILGWVDFCRCAVGLKISMCVWRGVSVSVREALWHKGEV